MVGEGVVVMMMMTMMRLVVVVVWGCVWAISLQLRCGDRLVGLTLRPFISPGVVADTQRCEVCLGEIVLLLPVMALFTD